MYSVKEKIVFVFLLFLLEFDVFEILKFKVRKCNHHKKIKKINVFISAFLLGLFSIILQDTWKVKRKKNLFSPSSGVNIPLTKSWISKKKKKKK